MPWAAIGAAGSLIGGIGSLFGGKKAAKMTPQEIAALESQTALYKSQAGLSDILKANYEKMFGFAEPILGEVKDYYKTLLGGDRSATARLVGPSADIISDLYRGSQGSILRNYARGGEMNLALEQGETARARDVSRLVSGMQPAAISGLSGLATEALGYGQGAASSALGGYGSAGYGYGNVGRTYQGNRLISYDIGRQSGTGLFGLFNQMSGWKGGIGDLFKGSFWSNLFGGGSKGP